MGNRFPFTRIFFILFYVVILSINASVYSNNDPILITVPEPADFRSTLLLVKESGIAANSGKEVSAALERCLGSLNSENYDVCAQDILVVMPSLLKFFGQVNDATKAPRLDAPFIGDGAVSGCGSCCDLGQMLALLGLIKTEVNTIDQELIECCEAIAREFQETWTTLANLQITASVDFSPVFSVINECCNSTFSSLADIKTTLTACCATINSEFQQTWTILANLEISAVVDLSGVFTSVTACCNGTFSSLGAIIANQQTIISNEQATFTAISDVRNTLTACCATINSEFQQTWTILGALASNASGTFSSLAACCNGTFSVL
ncbi:MAG TPA: hypothetical protein VHO47_00455, partial [Candidatus Babeliales bacterium]|nr:hypothetical protein [Candidatus Babeliales bacterium]